MAETPIEALIGQLAWIGFQAEGIMAWTCEPEPDFGMINSMASDIAANASIAIDALSGCGEHVPHPEPKP